MKTSLDTQHHHKQVCYYMWDKTVQLEIHPLWPLCNLIFLPFGIESFSTSGTSPRCSPCQAFNVFICHKRLLATEEKPFIMCCSSSRCSHLIFKVFTSFTLKYSVDNYSITSWDYIFIVDNTAFNMVSWRIKFRYYQTACKECAAGLWRAGSKWYYLQLSLWFVIPKCLNPAADLRGYSHQLHRKHIRELICKFIYKNYRAK